MWECYEFFALYTFFTVQFCTMGLDVANFLGRCDNGLEKTFGKVEGKFEMDEKEMEK